MRVCKKSVPIRVMDKKLLNELKQKLLEEKKLLEDELSSFAKKDPDMKGDWDTVYPDMAQAQDLSSSSLEEQADEVEEYENLTSREFVLESRLKEVNDALGRMEKDGYGVCEKCGKEISEERLLANPAAGCDVKHTE